MPQNFRGCTSYNPRLNQRTYTSILSPLNVLESSTHLSPQHLLVPFKTGKQLGGYTDGNENISFGYGPFLNVSFLLKWKQQFFVKKVQTEVQVNINDNTLGYITFCYNLYNIKTRNIYKKIIYLFNTRKSFKYIYRLYSFGRLVIETEQDLRNAI